MSGAFVDCGPFVPAAGGDGAAGGGGVALSAGTQSVATGTVVFANSNGVTFGMSGSSQITASVGGDTFSHSMFAPLSAQPLALNVNFPNSSLHLQPVNAPNVAFSQLNLVAFFSGASNSTLTASLTFNMGLYTKNAGTLSLFASTSFSSSIDHSGTVNTSLFNGIRAISVAWTSTLPKGDYWAGVNFMTNTAGANATLRLGLAEATRASVLSGFLGVALNASNQEILGRGFYSAATAALPAAIPFSDIRGTAIGAGSLPTFAFGQTV